MVHNCWAISPQLSAILRARSSGVESCELCCAMASVCWSSFEVSSSAASMVGRSSTIIAATRRIWLYAGASTMVSGCVSVSVGIRACSYCWIRLAASCRITASCLLSAATTASGPSTCHWITASSVISRSCAGDPSRSYRPNATAWNRCAWSNAPARLSSSASWWYTLGSIGSAISRFSSSSIRSGRVSISGPKYDHASAAASLFVTSSCVACASRSAKPLLSPDSRSSSAASSANRLRTEGSIDAPDGPSSRAYAASRSSTVCSRAIRDEASRSCATVSPGSSRSNWTVNASTASASPADHAAAIRVRSSSASSGRNAEAVASSDPVTR